jgi:hypothetical protein
VLPRVRSYQLLPLANLPDVKVGRCKKGLRPVLIGVVVSLNEGRAIGPGALTLRVKSGP